MFVFSPKYLEEPSRDKGYLQPLQEEQQNVPQPLRSPLYLSGSLGPVLHVLQDTTDSRRIPPMQARASYVLQPGHPPSASTPSILRLPPKRPASSDWLSRERPSNGDDVFLRAEVPRAEEGSSQEPSTPGARGRQRAVCSLGRVASDPRRHHCPVHVGAGDPQWPGSAEEKLQNPCEPSQRST